MTDFGGLSYDGWMQPGHANSEKFIPFAVTVTKAHIDAANAAGIAFALDGYRGFNWLSKERVLKFYSAIFVEAKSVFVGAGFFSQGAHSYSKSGLDQRVTVGRYCSIGENVTVMPAAEPLQRLSTCGFDYGNFPYHPKGFKTVKYVQSVPTLTIGSDVAVGNGSLLGRHVRIGHGAVVGARSIVTKDVPPYAIVAGSPATIRRYRFDEKTVERLLDGEWWNVDPSGLTGLDTANVPAFLDGFEALRDEGRLAPYRPRGAALHEIFKAAKTA